MISLAELSDLLAEKSTRDTLNEAAKIKNLKKSKEEQLKQEVHDAIRAQQPSWLGRTIALLVSILVFLLMVYSMMVNIHYWAGCGPKERNTETYGGATILFIENWILPVPHKGFIPGTGCSILENAQYTIFKTIAGLRISTYAVFSALCACLSSVVMHKLGLPMLDTYS